MERKINFVTTFPPSPHYPAHANMPPNQSIHTSQPMSDPVRYLLSYRRRVFDTQVRTDTQIIQEFGKRQNLDSQHIIHLGTSKTDRRVYIVFDYNNPDHVRCLISAFRGRHQKTIKLDKSQADYLHSRVDEWKASILAAKAYNAQFPIRNEVYSVSPSTAHIHQFLLLIVRTVRPEATSPILRNELNPDGNTEQYSSVASK